MGSPKDIEVKVIPAKIANPFVRYTHYSGKIVNNSSLHFGCFLNGTLHGVLSFGPSLDKSKIAPLVEGTKFNEFLELNRMAFDDKLPRNSESRCIGICLRLIKKNAPHIKWVISYADGTQCGDGTIYRASNFVLTDIKENAGILQLPSGEVIHQLSIQSQPRKPRPELGGASLFDVTGGVLFNKDIQRADRGKTSEGIPTAVYILFG